jgi:hypothetical protein
MMVGAVPIQIEADGLLGSSLVGSEEGSSDEAIATEHSMEEDATPKNEEVKE